MATMYGNYNGRMSIMLNSLGIERQQERIYQYFNVLLLGYKVNYKQC
jgi:hypothetical protein